MMRHAKTGRKTEEGERGRRKIWRVKRHIGDKNMETLAIDRCPQGRDKKGGMI